MRVRAKLFSFAGILYANREKYVRLTCANDECHTCTRRWNRMTAVVAPKLHFSPVTVQVTDISSVREHIV